jgi:hypothetical protein
MRTRTSVLGVVAVLGVLAGANLALAQPTSESERRNQAVSLATSWLSQRIENFVKSAHPLSRHHTLELQSVSKTPDGGYRVVFDESYKGRILGNVYWAEIAVYLTADGVIERYAWGSDSNFYPPYVVRKVADKFLR